jgi:predicted transcriptional regulator of viral defense system
MLPVSATVTGIRPTCLGWLRQLHRHAKGPVSATDAAAILGLPRRRAQRLLAYLANRGWLVRVHPGLYSPVPLEASDPREWRVDAWVVACQAFAPCYIGGWSACEHWELTEQVFRGVVVVTAKQVRRTRIEIQGTPFRVHVVPERKLFGTRPVWRGEVRVEVSDPARTIVDILDDPRLGGGMRHVADVVGAYFASSHRNDELVADYAVRLGNGAVFKRLGFFLELLEIPQRDALVDSCRRHLSAGLAALDPSVRTPGRIVKRWHLRVNVSSLARGSGDRNRRATGGDRKSRSG